MYRALNKSWKILNSMVAEVVLSKDKLIKAARKSTGHKDLGHDFQEEPLDQMLDSINKEARLNPIGKFITKKRLENLLAIRLRSEWWFKKYPEILEKPLYPVFLIIGLQRTGTTKLHRLMSKDPETRTLKSWEAINPAPLGGRLDESKLRIRQAKISEKALQFLSPGFFGIHPVEHLEPEEDILLLDVSFMSTTTEATMHVPSYASWLEKTDQSPAYKYAVKLLKLLQYQHPAKRWVLKSPHHLEFLNLTEKYFGNVHYIWTHRSVNDCLPSFFSMIAFSRSIFTDFVYPEEVRNHWLKKNGYMLLKALEFRKSMSTDTQFTDIFYNSLINEPFETIRKIYRSIGRIDTQLVSSIKKLIEIDQREKYGQHIYSMEAFGLTKEMIDEHTAPYQDYVKQLSDPYN